MIFIEKVKISIYTYNGSHWGRNVSFLENDGKPTQINLIFAENEVGKSTLIKAMAYCLNGEDVYSPVTGTQKSNLTDVLTDTVGGEKIKESKVFLQLIKGTERVVILRDIMHCEHPAQIYKGIDVDSITSETPSEFYKIRKDKNIDGNPTLNEFLMSFFDFPIHTAPNNKGGESQVYFQNILPLFFIPQNAWNDIQGSNPSYGVNSYKKIAFQILMNLSDVSVLDDKLRLQEKRAELKELQKSKDILDEVINLTDSNTSIALKNKIDVLRYDLEIYQSQIKELEMQSGIREESSESIRKEFRELNISIHNNQEEVNILNKEIDQCMYYLNKIQMDILKVDKLKTAKKLIQPIPISRCPHCFNDKNIDPDMEVESGSCSLCGSTINSISGSNDEDLLDYLKDERKDFETVLSQKDNKRRLFSGRIYQDQLKVKEIKRQIDKVDLELKPKFLESYFNVSNKIGSAETRITNLEKELKIVANYENLIVSINKLVIDIKALEKKLRDLMETGEDGTKLNRFSAKFKEYLATIDFLKYETLKAEKEQDEKERESMQSTFRTFFAQLSVNRDDYKPEINGKNIYNITSASGLIRIINAYYLALFETCLYYSKNTKHPGFLIIDEPRQQNLDLDSFKKLTEIYVAICNDYKDKSQIIFASGNRGVFKTSQVKVELGKTNYLIQKL